MKKIVLVIKDAYSYAGTENICNFMSECLGDEHDVTIYSLEGHGQPFYPFEKVKQIVSFEGESNPIKRAVARIQQEGFDTVFFNQHGPSERDVRVLEPDDAEKEALQGLCL